MEDLSTELLHTIEFFYTKAPLESREVFKDTERKLIEFTKLEDAWATCFSILRTPDLSINQMFFAAITLKSKMIFDFDSFRSNHPELADKFGDEIISLLKTHLDSANSSKPPEVVINSLCLALAIFCIHKNTLPEIDQVLNSNINEI